MKRIGIDRFNCDQYGLQHLLEQVDELHTLDVSVYYLELNISMFRTRLRLYTTRAGIVIGRAGETIRFLKSMSPYDIDVIEINVCYPKF